MSKVAFELRADAAEFSGGTVSLPGGEAFDVGEALKDGDKIVLDPDAKSPGKDKETGEQRPPTDKEAERAARAVQIIDALDAYPALKRVAAADEKPTVAAPEGGDSK
jgi:hypothetical protein